MIPLSSPWITLDDQQAIIDVLNTRHLSLGPKLKEFEAKCAQLAQVEHAVAVSSGTAALTLAAQALGWRPEDEILTPSFSFVASANTLMHVGARPVFVDIDEKTWNLDPQDAADKVTSKTRGIQAVDIFGLPCDGQALEDLCQQKNLDLVEDACEAVGAFHLDGRPCGRLGRVGAWAFYPNKQITTGEGGVFLTQEASLAEKARSLANQGRGVDEVSGHVRLGWNYRLSDLNAALGLSQLSRLELIVQKRREVAKWYAQELKDCADLELMKDLDRSWFVYVVALRDPSRRESFEKFLSQKEIQCRSYFYPIHLMPHMQKAWGTRAGLLPKTEALALRTVALPFFTQMDRNQVAQVGEAIREFFAYS